MSESVEDLLSQLRTQIAALPADNPHVVELRELVDELDQRLDEDDDSVVERVQESAVRWETEHSEAATVLRRIADVLGGAGI